ncbi:hypothetical protein F4805DRAFT_453339 [Annulohypoxylon moriforme]|nr:hypothetical protein F4805DRAFT_453339 [Annulohypoxylon moriforme]
MSSNRSDQMGSSMGSGSGSAETSSATPIPGDANTQANVTPIGATPRREPLITSINDNPDIQTSIALLSGDADTDPVTIPKWQAPTSARRFRRHHRMDSFIMSDPIMIPGRGNGAAHSATSPLRGTADDELTPGRPPSTGPRYNAAGTARDLLATPIGGRHGASPGFDRLMSPGSYMNRSLNPTPIRPSVSPANANASTQAQAQGSGRSPVGNVGSYDNSSVLSGGDDVAKITSPSSGVTRPVAFSESATSRSSRQRGSHAEASTARGPRAAHPRPEASMTGPARGPRNMGRIRDANIRSSSVASLMPRSSQDSHGSPDSSDQSRTVRPRGSSGFQRGPRPHPPMIMPALTRRSSDSSPSTTDVEQLPILPARRGRRGRSYGTMPAGNDNDEQQQWLDDDEYDQRQRHIGFWHRFTRSEAVLFTMFLCSVVFGFTFMALVMVHELRSTGSSSK